MTALSAAEIKDIEERFSKPPYDSMIPAEALFFMTLSGRPSFVQYLVERRVELAEADKEFIESRLFHPVFPGRNDRIRGGLVSIEELVGMDIAEPEHVQHYLEAYIMAGCNIHLRGDRGQTIYEAVQATYHRLPTIFSGEALTLLQERWGKVFDVLKPYFDSGEPDFNHDLYQPSLKIPPE